MNVSLSPWPHRPNERKPTQAAEGLPRRRFTVAGAKAMAAAGVMDEDEWVEPIGQVKPLDERRLWIAWFKGYEGEAGAPRRRHRAVLRMSPHR